MQPTQYANSPTIQTPQYNQPAKNKIRVNPDYISTILGALNILLIVFLFPTWVSVAAVPKTAYLSLERLPVENAYLFFAVFAFLIEIAAFIIFLLDVPNLDALKRVPLNLILAIKDILFGIPIFALAIASAVFETQQRNYVYRNYGTKVYSYFNPGAYAAASFFGFIVVILYIGHCAMSVRRHLGEMSGNSNGSR